MVLVKPLLEQVLYPGCIDLQQFLARMPRSPGKPRLMFSFDPFLGFDLQPGLQGIAGSVRRSLPCFFIVLVG